MHVKKPEWFELSNEEQYVWETRAEHIKESGDVDHYEYSIEEVAEMMYKRYLTKEKLGIS